MSSQAIPVFAISLARAVERRAAMERHLRRLSVAFEYVEGVDRRTPVACVMEDDGRLRPSGIRLLREGCASLDFDLCLLDSADRNNQGFLGFDRESAVQLAPRIRAYTLSDGPHGLHAYLITGAAAEQRLKHAFPI